MPYPAPRPRRTTLWVLLGVLVAGLAVCCVGALAARGAGRLSVETPTAAGPARDGKFQFDVVHVECGLTRVGTDAVNRKPQGQFCLAHVTVTNIGTAPQTLDSRFQHAYGADGARFDTDFAAGFYVNPQFATYLDNINPGNAVDAVFVFDIPRTARLATFEFHDSALSGGARVPA